MTRIFVGHDPREQKAFDVCKYSITRTCMFDIPDIEMLSSSNIPEYNRDHGEPQSTDFTFTRFWVPYLSNYTGYSIFCDCDFLFLKDIRIIREYVKPEHAVSVVKHPPYIPNSEIKMDGVAQHRSYRKNWASLMVFNNEHPACKALTPDYLNLHLPGIDFHHFKWCNDDQIGSIPLEWNVLDGYYHVEFPKAIHYTDGGPWFKDYQNTRYSDIWLKFYQDAINDRQIWR